MSMRTLGDDTVRGGQTVFHGIRMWSQLFRVGVLVVAALTLAVPFVQLYREHFGYDIYAAGMLTLAEVKLAMGYGADAGQEVRLENGDTVVATLGDIAAYVPWREVRLRMSETLSSGMWLGARIGAGVVLGSLVWFRWRGRRLKRSKRLRGAELVTARQLRDRIDPLQGRVVRKLAGGQAPYRIAGVPYPDRAETQHTIVSGTTGSGKTVLISDLVQQIRKRGERCVIYDKMGSYTRAFFDPEKDVLLNPLDARAPRWSPFFEARSHRDFDMMAAALIPAAEGHGGPFLGHRRAPVVLQRRRRALAEGRDEEPGAGGAPAQDGSLGPGEGHGGHGGAIHRGPAEPEDRALGARHADRQHRRHGGPGGQRGTLFDQGVDIPGAATGTTVCTVPTDCPVLYCSRGDQHASLRGLISTWLEIAVNSMLSLGQDDGRRIWVILDELPTLHQVPSLQPGLAESRQFGGCFVLGVQVASALARSLRAKRRGDDFGTVRYARRVRRPGQGYRAVVRRQPGPQRGGGIRRGRELRRGPLPRRRDAHAEARASGPGAAVGNHAAAEPERLPETPRPLPGGADRARVREAPEGGAAVRGETPGAPRPG